MGLLCFGGAVDRPVFGGPRPFTSLVQGAGLNNSKERFFTMVCAGTA